MIRQKHLVNIKTHSRNTAACLERIILQAGGFRLQEAGEDPDLLIRELGDAYSETLAEVDPIIGNGNTTELFVTAADPNTEMLRQAMRIGAKEFLEQPFEEDAIVAALNDFKQRRIKYDTGATVKNGRVFHLLGAKGGVGTTTLAVNLGLILAEEKRSCSVALVDLNTVFGEIPLFLSVQTDYHWGHIAENMDRLDGTFLLNAMAKHPSGVHVLPSPSHLNGHPPVTPQVMEQLLESMKKTFDIIIVDGGQSLDDPALTSMSMADQVLVVTLLSLPCLHNTNNVLASLENAGNIHGDSIRLVVNRHLKNADITIKEAEENVKKDIFWNIPNDYKTTMSAINRGVPLHHISPRKGISKNLTALADALVIGEHVKPNKSLWRLFKR